MEINPYATVFIFLLSVSFNDILITGFVYSEHLSSPPVFSGVRVNRSLVLYVCFVDSCLSFCTFSFGHCVVCSSSKYDSDYLPLVSSNSSYPIYSFWCIAEWTIVYRFVPLVFGHYVISPSIYSFPIP
jgi:hypothetical protein